MGCNRIYPQRLNVAARRKFAVLALLCWPALPTGAAEDAALMSSLPPDAAYGQYAVGVATGFAVDALAHLDPWNGFYGSADYQALLRGIDASGQRRTVVFQLWYPAPPREDAEAGENQRRPLPAASGRRANYHDFFFRDPHIAVRRTIAGMAAAEITQVRPGGALAEMSEADRQAALSTLVNEAARLFPWPAFVRGELPFGQDPGRTRKATGEAAFAPKPPVGERYDELGWTVYEDGQEAYLPHVVRDWYALAWFDWHLKGDENARARLAADDPFGERTHVRKEMR